MNLIVLAIAAGVVGTLVMDSVNYALARIGILVKLDIAMIGRMAAGWSRGRFRYRHPGQMTAVKHEWWLGCITHYVISILFALIYVVGWRVLIGGAVSAIGALMFGVATSTASQFLVFPSMGLGVFGHRSPEGLRAPLSSLANHTFFGVGMALAIALF
jgi:hypothetical protein